MVYWEGSPEQWEAISNLQQQKRGFLGIEGTDALRSDQYVMTNPVTGRDVPLKDLVYASKHMAKIYSSGMIRETRWAFLWYH